MAGTPPSGGGIEAASTMLAAACRLGAAACCLATAAALGTGMLRLCVATKLGLLALSSRGGFDIPIFACVVVFLLLLTEY